MTQSQTHRDLYAVLEAIVRLEKISVGNSVDDVLIAQELGIDIQDVQDYLNILDEEGKVLLATSFTGCSAFLKLKGRLALKDPEYFLPEVKSGSGLTILGNVHTGGGDFVGRDYSSLSLESKRLQLHQEAYTLWRKLVATVYDSNKIGDTVMECQDWWNNNCLHLSSDASTAFKSAYLSASHHGRFVEARESVQLIKENWADIEGAGDIIMAAAASIRAGKLETDNLPGDKIGQDKVSAIMGDSAANVNIGKDNRNVSAIEGDAVGGDKHVINNYTRPSSLDGVPLSDEEKELLVAASQNEGEIFMINTQQVNFVKIRRNYIKDEEPSSAAPYREALEDLIERGYVKYDRGIIDIIGNKLTPLVGKLSALL